MYRHVDMEYNEAYEDMAGKGKVFQLMLIPFLMHKIY